MPNSMEPQRSQRSHKEHEGKLCELCGKLRDLCG